MDTALPDESAKHGVDGHLYIVQPSGAELERIANYIRGEDRAVMKREGDRYFITSADIRVVYFDVAHAY